MFTHIFLNRSLDRLVRPEIRLLRRPRPAFQVCGYTGLALAILLSMTLVIYQHLSPFIMLAIILTAVLTFLAQAMITKIITGEEDLVYYRHEIAVLTVAALLLWLLHQPILPYLDATLLGVGIFLACGRVGCLMVGCCHGRPHNWGVCYRQEHADAGFESCYVGVRLFPSQLIESLWVFSIVLVGSLLVLSHQEPGTALTWYVVTYDLGRFSFEFMRGDVGRPYLWGFSEAQLVSVLLMCVMVWAEMVNLLPFQLWHVFATVCIVCVLLGVVLKRRLQKTPLHRLLHPNHMKEIAELLLQTESAGSSDVKVYRTSLGIQLSASQIESDGGLIHHYALSALQGNLAEEAAGALVRLIVQFKHYDDPCQLVKGREGGIFHLLIGGPQGGQDMPKTGSAKAPTPPHRAPDPYDAGPERSTAQSISWHNEMEARVGVGGVVRGGGGLDRPRRLPRDVLQKS